MSRMNLSGYVGHVTTDYI